MRPLCPCFFRKRNFLVSLPPVCSSAAFVFGCSFLLHLAVKLVQAQIIIIVVDVVLVVTFVLIYHTNVHTEIGLEIVIISTRWN